jgi:hypothetical protein
LARWLRPASPSPYRRRFSYKSNTVKGRPTLRLYINFEKDGKRTPWEDRRTLPEAKAWRTYEHYSEVPAHHIRGRTIRPHIQPIGNPLYSGEAILFDDVRIEELPPAGD